MDSPLYLALICDVVASREQPQRAALTEQMIAANTAVNEALGSKALAAPLTLTAGDEVQGLLRQPEAAVTAIQELTDRGSGAWPFPHLVFGVGLGTLSTGPVPPPPGQAPNPAILDGPSFHRARAALLEARRRGDWVCWQGFADETTQTLNALFDLIGAIRSEWTATQGQNTFGVRQGEHQKDWAAKRGVHPSVISESLKAAHFSAILAGEVHTVPRSKPPHSSVGR